MTVLVDQCRWEHRDHIWCHMVSDSSLEELHSFAEALGIPSRGFHGDHYDLPSHVRERAIALGAVPVTSRELVRRLGAAGLRLSAAQRRGYRHAESDDHGFAVPASERGQ